jgi:hypothetical protein
MLSDFISWFKENLDNIVNIVNIVNFVNITMYKSLIDIILHALIHI